MHLVLALLLAAPALSEVPKGPPPGVSAWAWDGAGSAGRAEVLVVLAEQPRPDEAARDRRGLERRRAVHAELRGIAERTQAPLIAWLEARGVAHRSFSSVNALLVEADRDLMTALVRRPDVKRLAANPRVRLPEPPPDDSAATPKAGEPWGIQRIRAPEAWDLGFTGEGIVVGGQDTGVRWTHQALMEHYRGWDGASASHDYNWHDSIHAAGAENPCGSDAVEPCDDAGHGTHTLGTATGGTDGEPIGVAPGAKWIGCRNMDEGVGSPASYLECFDWLLAPWPIGGDPADGDPALGAEITVNSWACPPSEGCDWDVFTAAVDAHRAAGILTVSSAGNSGSSCGTVRTPPALYDSVFSIGASNSNDRLAGFSSRGPSRNTDLQKPEVVAPGTGVRSATAGADDSYDSWNGTSMAAPHVAGAAAVLWSAVPALRGDPEATEAVFRRTAFPLRAVVESCGGDYDFGPNNSWGHGRIDLAQAILFAEAPESELVCDDGIDEDGDHFADCEDPDCAGAAGCFEADHCADRVDNDLDGLVDCLDDECLGNPLCPEDANCADGLDNDLDGDADCADRDCDLDSACPALAVGAAHALETGAPDPPLAGDFQGNCRVAKWRLCHESVLAGALPLVLTDGALPEDAHRLRFYLHSDGRDDLRVSKSGADLGFE